MQQIQDQHEIPYGAAESIQQKGVWSACIEEFNAGQRTFKKMSWNQLTEIGEFWFNNCGAQALSVSTPETYEHYLSLYEQNPTEEIMLKADIRSGRTDPECYRGMLRYSYMNKATENYRTNLENIVKAFSAKYTDIGYCQGMNQICVWMLLFMDESSSFWVLSRLVETLLEPGFFAGKSFAMNGFFVECAVLEQCCRDLVPEQSIDEIYTRETYIQTVAIKPLMQMFVTWVDIESILFIWNHLLEEGSDALIYSLLAIFSFHSDKIQAGIDPFTLVKEMGKLGCNLQNRYQDARSEWPAKKLAEIRREVRHERSKHWLHRGSNDLRRLDEHTNVPLEEIDEIQVQFQQYLESREGYFTDEKVGINKNEFKQILKGLNPQFVDYFSEIFDLYDTDHTGQIDFREIVCFISLISKGTFADKLKLCFDIHDLDKSGYLKEYEIKNLIHSILKPLQKQMEKSGSFFAVRLQTAVTQRKYMQLVNAHNGFVSFYDFKYAVMADSMLLHQIEERFQISHRSNTDVPSKGITKAFSMAIEQEGKHVWCTSCATSCTLQ